MHDEDEDIDYTQLQELFGLESILLKSVGITIGSSTSHLLFSELVARRRDSRTSRYEIAERAVTHRSPIVFTPYVEGVSIDAVALRDFIMKTYREAGLSPQDIDTGAVIITGYAARKENAEAIVDIFSRWAGKFVCATAGPRLEAMLAAHGSGAVAYAREHKKTVMNVDIGGGTTKIVIVREGEIVDIASIFVGSRVIAVDAAGMVVRIEEAGRLAAAKAGIDLQPGQHLSPGELTDVSARLADALLELCFGKTLSPFTERLMETGPLQHGRPVDAVMFSGGVAEYIYGREREDFGDLGPRLGERIALAVKGGGAGLPLLEPAERIRATVMGASQYSLQMSGSTVYLSPNAVLPKRNLQVVRVQLAEDVPAERDVEASIGEALLRYDADLLLNGFPLALTFKLPAASVPSPRLLRGLSGGIASAMKNGPAGRRTLVVILDMDIAHLMGSSLAEKLGPDYEILCLDGIEAGDLDYIDIGSEIEFSHTIPVVIKNLVFAKDMA